MRLRHSGVIHPCLLAHFKVWRSEQTSRNFDGLRSPLVELMLGIVSVHARVGSKGCADEYNGSKHSRPGGLDLWLRLSTIPCALHDEVLATGVSRLQPAYPEH